MLQLSEIWVYPIKSLGGISLQESNVTHRGLERDRRWMLVDDKGVFLSQRENPELALFETEMEEDFLIISHREKTVEKVKVALYPTANTDTENLDAVVWDDTVAAYEVDKTISNWFSEILGYSVRLVYMPEESHRKVDSDYAVTPEDINSFSDGFPYLIIGQSSLDDLNSRMKEAVPMKRFRPNFVFTGGESYEEETWSEFTIGNLPFYGVKPCGRCVMITVDPEKGIVAGKEPLLTLSKYKRVGNNVIFGQNLIAKQEGSVSIGDVVAVSKKIGF
ncbi:MOSC domain-containing protein [Flavobacterium sp. K5-23]|uniref:MOSC domain-containing protein n=1 Tax=Flavobacterium sp. K5-23 TaxID=2746225 RepID=UPI00200F2729|nr:MOSC N-terminal beta barrel domain-containing protein [Flavobacterium sp. K5-23]UQD55142.1 MOSC domain-containing protein [Flavobacterium sp. K5-23]